MYQLSAASFISIVGARAGITDDIARWHEDWGPCNDHEAFSVLLTFAGHAAGTGRVSLGIPDLGLYRRGEGLRLCAGGRYCG